MPSLLDTTVTANYLVTSPSTQFGTRELTVIKVAIDDVSIDFADANSLFSKSVRALQQTAELYAVYEPVSSIIDYFCAIIATQTQSQANAQDDETAGYGMLETAIAAGNGNNTAVVSVATIS